MTAPGDAIWICAAVLAVAAASLSGLGLTQKRYRGFGWWLAGLWLAAAGLVLVGLAPQWRLAQGVGAALLVQWPLATLAGLRRFHGRLHLPADQRMDIAIATLCLLAAAGAPWLAADGVGIVVLPVVSTVLSHLYAASLLAGGADGREGMALRLLAFAIALAGLLPLLPAGASGDPVVATEWRALAAALGAVVMAFAALTLMHERTERQLRESRRRLRVLANMDPLTQVPNRRHFHELATLALQQDEPGSACLLLFDIDHFKQINDHLGHAAGDRALRMVARCMLEHLRSDDIPGRHGGDEFVLLLRQTAVREAMAVAARIVVQIRQEAERASLPALSLSFGIVQMHPQEPVDDALRRADRALYEAKRQGRSRAVAADGQEDQPVFTESRRLGLT